MITKNKFFKIKDIAGVFAGAFGLILIAQAFLPEEMGFVSLYLVQILIFALPLLILMFLRKIKNFGFKKIKFKKVLKFAALGYLYYFIIVLVLAQISMSWGIEIPGFQQQESHIPLIGEEAMGAVIAITIITFFAPILEEIFFRGFIFRTMLKRWPLKLAFVASAVIFAVIHLEFQSIIPLFLLGLILNWMFYRTKSLYPGIFFHIINNVIALSLEYYVYLNPEVLEMATAATGSIAILSP